MRGMSILPGVPLVPHPACAVRAAWQVEVSLARVGVSGTLELRYRLPSSGVFVPAPALPARADNLWRHTCAELFVAAEGETAYREFNFSPSGQWAAYDFVAYRERALTLPDVPRPRIVPARTEDAFLLAVTLAPACLPVTAGGALRVSATMVLEADDGALSYWAAKHPAAQPDFHHRDGFVLSLT